MTQCEYCENPGVYRRAAEETLCEECYADWLYCQRKGQEAGAEP